VQGVLGDGDAAGCEMPEAGEVGLAGSRVGELAPAEREVPEGGREALQGGRLHRRLGRRRGAVADVELLEAIEGWGPEPGVEAGEREVGDGEAAGGAPVRGEDAGDGVSSASSAPPQVARLSGAERQSRRHWAESACVRAILGGEERDDVAEDLVGEKADQIGAGATSCHNFLPRSNS